VVYAIADFVARHAIGVLIAITIAMLALSAAAWHLLVIVGPRTWTLAIDLWNRARQTRIVRWLAEVPLLGRVLGGTLTLARYLGTVCRSTLHAFSIITRFADPQVLFLIGVVVYAVLAAKRLRLLAAAWVVTTLSGALLNRVLKAIFERSRPLHDHGLTLEGGWSFPSGHASGSMLVYGLLAYLVVRTTPPVWHIPAALAGIALVIFVGSSRVLLQVHYLAVRWREQQRQRAA